MKHSARLYRFWTWLRWSGSSFLVLSPTPSAWAQHRQAAVEVRVPVPPQPVLGSDGVPHLAYELHLTNFYSSTGTLLLKQLVVLPQGATTPLARFSGAQLQSLLAHPAAEPAPAGVPIEAGKRVVLWLWLPLPGRGPHYSGLQHQLDFETTRGEQQRVDGVLTPLNPTPPLVLGPPLQTGPWLVHEGPGNAQSHHWGSLVAVNGHVTIPQRYAIDFFGLDTTRHAVTVTREQLPASRAAEWIGFGAPVLAVADGIIRDLRDGELDQRPFATQPTPTELTLRTLLGNFVVLEIAPHVFVEYGHLQSGSLTGKIGDKVRRGTVLGRLGQSGNSNAPHLHLQVTTAATFAEAEGLPFVFRTFDYLGKATIGEVLDRASTIARPVPARQQHQRQLPLDGTVLAFPY